MMPSFVRIPGRPSRIARLISFAVASVTCFAGSSDASAGCAWGDLVQPQTRAAIIKPDTAKPGTARLNFIEDTALKPRCPNTSAGCKQRAYIVPGDVVLAGPKQGAYTCAGFQGMHGAAAIGWLPVASLTLLPPPSQAATDWAGHWVTAEQDIVIMAGARGMVAVSGETTWGTTEARHRQTASVQTGTLNGTARPVDGVLAFTEGDGRTLDYAEGDEVNCRARLLRRGPYLVVLDNNNCGGVNVSFSGLYVRKLSRT